MIINLVLQRVRHTDFATYGLMYLEFEEQRLYSTLELPWRGNQDMISCIPPGRYPYFLRLSPKRKATVIELKGVPSRDNIQIHIANLPKNLLGCIAPGMRFGILEDCYGVLESGSALADILYLLKDTTPGVITVHGPGGWDYENV